MPVQQTTPDKAKAILDQDPEAVYIDVRSIPEFVQGHAAGAINIPLFHLAPAKPDASVQHGGVTSMNVLSRPDSPPPSPPIGAGQMVPNPEFPRVAQAVLPKEKKIVVGCKMGGRSQKACEILVRIGYQNIFNIDGGFGGNEHQKGWKDLGLPVSTDNSDGVSYESLAKKANK